MSEDLFRTPASAAWTLVSYRVEHHVEIRRRHRRKTQRRQSGVWKLKALACVEDLCPPRDDTTNALSIEVCSKTYPIEP